MPNSGSSKPLSRLARAALANLLPSDRLRLTREGVGYAAVWAILLFTGLYQQINMVLLIAGLAAGPLLGSIFVTASMLRGLKLTRKSPPYVFAGETLSLVYQLENPRRFSDALALTVSQALTPAEPAAPGASEATAEVFFARVPGRGRDRQSWKTDELVRGRYLFRPAQLVTRSPFGLLERVISVESEGSLVVYPMVGSLTRRWRLIHREATETRRGRRHDRSTQQMEYHGLRDYRPGDSPRWIHWRTTARLGQPMVKEFEQQNEQDLTLLIDPWLPRSKPSASQRDLVEEVIRFAATLCYETCRSRGRRLLLGWTGPTPGVIQSPASIKLLHELLEALALMRPNTEGTLARLFDAVPPAALREALVLVVTTRSINLQAELEASSRLGDHLSGSRLSGRLLLLDASRGDLQPLVRYGPSTPHARNAATPPPIWDEDPDPTLAGSPTPEIAP